MNPSSFLFNKEVNIPEGPADLTARGLHQVLHEVRPVGVVGWHDYLVSVQEGDVLVPVHVPGVLLGKQNNCCSKYKVLSLCDNLALETVSKSFL